MLSTLHVAPGSTQIPAPSARTVQLDQLMTTRSQPPYQLRCWLCSCRGPRGPCDQLASTPMQVQLNAPTAAGTSDHDQQPATPCADVSGPLRRSGLAGLRNGCPAGRFNPVARNGSVRRATAPAWVVRERGSSACSFCLGTADEEVIQQRSVNHVSRDVCWLQ